MGVSLCHDLCQKFGRPLASKFSRKCFHAHRNTVSTHRQKPGRLATGSGLQAELETRGVIELANDTLTAEGCGVVTFLHQVVDHEKVDHVSPECDRAESRCPSDGSAPSA